MFTFEVAAQRWNEVTPATGNVVTPTSPQLYGTFGRWRYAPAHHVFVLVNSVDDDVYLYRLSL